MHLVQTNIFDDETFRGYLEQLDNAMSWLHGLDFDALLKMVDEALVVDGLEAEARATLKMVHNLAVTGKRLYKSIKQPE